MRKIIVAASAIMLVAAGLRADSIDDVEATHRHVPVQQVELEHARKQVDELTAKLAKAKADNRNLKKQLDDTKAALAIYQKKDVLLAAASANAPKELAIGMTLEECEDVIRKQFPKASISKPTLKASSNSIKVYDIDVCLPSSPVIMTYSGDSRAPSTPEPISFMLNMEHEKLASWQRL